MTFPKFYAEPERHVSNDLRALQLKCGHQHAWMDVCRNGREITVCIACGAAVTSPTPRRATTQVIPAEPTWSPYPQGTRT